MLLISKHRDKTGTLVVKVGRKIVYDIQGIVDELQRYSQSSLEDLMFNSTTEDKWTFPSKKCSCGLVHQSTAGARLASDLLWFNCHGCDSTMVVPAGKAKKVS